MKPVEPETEGGHRMLRAVTDVEDAGYAAWLREVVNEAAGFAVVSFVQTGPDWVDIPEADLFISAISLKDGEKLERLKRLQKERPEMTLVVAGPDTEDVLDAWQVDFAAFLRGTRNPGRLQQVVLEVQQRLDEKEVRKLQMTWKNVLRFIPMEQIISIEKDLRKTNVCLADGEVCTSYMRMDDVLEQLDETFIRIHFSCIINRRYIQKVRRDCVILRDGRHLPVSRTYAKNLMPLMKDGA